MAVEQHAHLCAAADSGAEMLEPSSGTTLTDGSGGLQASSTVRLAAVGVPFKFRGDAYANTRLHALAVVVNNEVAHSDSWEEDDPLLKSHWEFEWTPRAEGTYVFQPLVVGRSGSTVLYLPQILNQSAFGQESGTTDSDEGDIDTSTPTIDLSELTEKSYLPTIRNEGGFERSSVEEADNIDPAAEKPIADSFDKNDQPTMQQGATNDAVADTDEVKDDVPAIEEAIAAGVTTIEELTELYGGVAGDPTVIYVDNTPPSVHISTTQVIQILGLNEVLVPIYGHAEDNVKLAHVDVRINNGPWRHARFGSLGLWGVIWNPGELVDNELIEISARAIDVAGHTTFAQQSIQVDMASPELSEFSIFYEDTTGATLPVTPGETLINPTALRIQWTEASDGSGISSYRVGFTNSVSAASDELTAYDGPGELRLPISGPGQWYAHIIAVDGAGNSIQDVIGPIYVQ